MAQYHDLQERAHVERVCGCVETEVGRYGFVGEKEIIQRFIVSALVEETSVAEGSEKRGA